MKRRYSLEEIERWRDKTHRRTSRRAVTSKEEALTFVNEVGYCFAFHGGNADLPCLWQAAGGMRRVEASGKKMPAAGMPMARALRQIVPDPRLSYSGKLLMRKPTLVSLEFLPYFHVQAGRTGEKDEYMLEHKRGKLSPLAKAIMDVLKHSSPMTTTELKRGVEQSNRPEKLLFEKALNELQIKLFIARAEAPLQSLSTSWAPIAVMFPQVIRRAQRITPDQARFHILARYFQNRLVGTVSGIGGTLRWSRQEIFRTLGQLVSNGVITTGVVVDGEEKSQYCLI